VLHWPDREARSAERDNHAGAPGSAGAPAGPCPHPWHLRPVVSLPACPECGHAICAGPCGEEIDPTTCMCGEPITGAAHDNHYPVPLGCACHAVLAAGGLNPTAVEEKYWRKVLAMSKYAASPAQIRSVLTPCLPDLPEGTWKGQKK